MGVKDPLSPQLHQAGFGQGQLPAEVAVPQDSHPGRAGEEPAGLDKIGGSVPQMEVQFRPRLLLKDLPHPGNAPVAVRHDDDPHCGILLSVPVFEPRFGARNILLYFSIWMEKREGGEGKMSEGQGLTPEQLGILLKVASSKMGKDPIQLKKELADGSYDRVLGSIGADPEKIKAMMENRAAMEELLGSPQVQAILKELLANR